MMNSPIGQVRHNTNTEIGKIHKRHFSKPFSLHRNRVNGYFGRQKKKKKHTSWKTFNLPWFVLVWSVIHHTHTPSSSIES